MVHQLSVATHGDLGILHFKKPTKELCVHVIASGDRWLMIAFCWWTYSRCINDIYIYIIYNIYYTHIYLYQLYIYISTLWFMVVITKLHVDGLSNTTNAHHIMWWSMTHVFLGCMCIQYIYIIHIYIYINVKDLKW